MKQKLLVRTLFLWASLWVGISCAWAADGSADPPFRFYSVADGLTQSDVYAIAQDRAGYLWFTTARGLNRYDGKSFDHYTIADGLPHNNLTAIYVDVDNTIFVGDARGGITVLQGSRVLRTIEPFADSNASVLDIEIIGQAVFAVVDGVGIARMTPSEDEYRTQQIGDASMGITEITAFGTDVWVASETGLYKLTFGSNGGLTKLEDTITHTHVDKSGRLWLADSSNNVGYWDGDKFRQQATIESDSPIVDIVTDVDGVLWAATVNALFKVETAGATPDAAPSPVRRFSGVAQVSALYADRENSLWLSSSSRLIRFLGERFQHYQLRSGADFETIWSIAEDRQGRFWFGTQSKLLLRNDDETLSTIDTRFGVPDGFVRDIVADANGDLWFGVSDKGLFKFSVEDMRADFVASTAGKDILDISLDSEGVVWFSTGSFGVFRYAPSTEELLNFDAPQDTSVYTLDTDEDGSVWYGADEVGLVHLAPLGNGDYRQTVYGEHAHFDNRLFNHINLTGPAEAWITTEEGGLYQFKSGEFSVLDQDMPFSDQTLYLVEELQNGTLVVGGEQGLYQFSPGEPGIAHYDQLTGFSGVETNVHASLIDSSQRLWIGTVNGVTRMDVSQPLPAKVELVPAIIRTETELDRLPVIEGDEIDPDQFGVNVEFAAVSLSNAEGVEYSYRLVGADEAWGTATTNKTVSYWRIPPASYEFMVRARLPGGSWSREIASQQFAMLPYFWQQSWFLLFVGVTVVALIAAFTVYRTRNIQRHNETLRAQVIERTRSIEEAKQRLELSNEQLSQEVESRQKSDSARVDIETRFRRAFENAPIGMGLANEEGILFDANSALQKMFWCESSYSSNEKFSIVIEEQDRDRFEAHYAKIILLSGDELDKKFTCTNTRGDTLQTIINLSPVTTDSGEFQYAVVQVQDVTESLKLTNQLEYQASYDELTQLLNRRAFETELQRAWERGSGGKGPSYLMFMDLDQFKVVNDTSGHGAGDQLLRAVSEILVDAVRANDIVARLGGDEFGIILWECPTDVATRIAEEIRASIENFRFHWDTETYRIGVSIGGLPIEQSSGDISELQQLADAACYAAKEAGRNRVHMVAGAKDSARVRRGQVRWVQRLREAMDNNRFAIYGQVIKPLAEDVDEPEHIEILLRLRDPESRKLIPPGAFLPAAERYGLSVELDQWVVGSLLDTLFVHQAFQAERRVYWINLSGISVGDKRFAEFLRDAMERSPLQPGTVNFEITETAVIRSIAEAGKLISDLHEMGCKFALDDFGSGLSSFGYLKKLPVDHLKIDGMFIRDILQDETNRIFVKSIIDIARSLNIKTTAEFVENNEMLELVRELGADYAQGFGVGRPFVLAPKLTGIVDLKSGMPDQQIKAG
ncbi:MAG: EAL domain-containing protein [Woeseiaceae bacterium]